MAIELYVCSPIIASIQRAPITVQLLLFLVVTAEDKMIPRIVAVRHIISDFSLVLQCFSSRSFAGTFLWKLNASLIGNQSRYSHNNDSLSIRNVTADDLYNSYTCKENEDGIESDPYRIQSSDPSVITFTPNVTMVVEHESLNLSCNSDCNPICTWRWTKSDPLSGEEKNISAEKSLQINNIARHDAGRYSCKVQNVISGTTYARFVLLDVVYGPDKLLFNTPNRIVEMEYLDSITIFCSADCFPPCQIHWSESQSQISSADLRIANVTIGGNFTCHARNERNANTTISNSIAINVNSVLSYYTTITITKEITSDFLSKDLLMYVTLGMGALLAISFCIWFLRKFVKCPCKGRMPTNPSLEGGGEENLPEENPTESYWTIVTNDKGELSTALETSINLTNEQNPIGNNIVAEVGELEELSQLDRVEVDMGLDGYITPIHSGHINTGFAEDLQTTEV